MARFNPAFDRMIENEGGMILHTVPGDRGGMTYAGIARNRWPDWVGWSIIDSGRRPDEDQVRRFYRAHFWRPLQADGIRHQPVAESIFDYAVNSGVRSAVRSAQRVLGVIDDGIVGPQTLNALNAADPDHFVAAYTLEKIRRYAKLAAMDGKQRKFLLGWINRSLRSANPQESRA